MTKVGDVQVVPATLNGRRTAGRITSDQPTPRQHFDGLHSRLPPAMRNVLLWTAAVGLTILLQWHWLVLYLDIRYTFGAFRSGGGLAASDVFIHRPMAHKLLMSWLDHLTFCPTIFRERLAVSIAILFAGLAGAGLARVLRVWTAPTLATCVGLATFTALAWAPTVTILQPEWTAALLCVGAVSSGLARGRHRVGSWHSPLIAGAGLLAGRRRAAEVHDCDNRDSRIGCLVRAPSVASVDDYGLDCTADCSSFRHTLSNNHEWQWFLEMPRLNPPGSINWQSMWRSLWNVAWLNPILSFLPAAIILGFRLSRRRSWIIGTVLAMVVVMAGVVVQRGFFPITTALCQCWPLGWSPLPAATGGNRRGGCRTSPLSDWFGSHSPDGWYDGPLSGVWSTWSG